MDFVRREIFNPFSDDEIMGDHRIIVGLYLYASSLETALEDCAKHPGSSRRIISLVLPS